LLGFWAPLLPEARAKTNLGSTKINVTLGPGKWKIGEKEGKGPPSQLGPRSALAETLDGRAGSAAVFTRAVKGNSTAMLHLSAVN